MCYASRVGAVGGGRVVCHTDGGAPLRHTSTVTDPATGPVPGPVWRAPKHPLPPDLARRTGQVLAMAEVSSPRGKRYRVQIRPETPKEIKPLPYVADAADDILPAAVGAAVGALGNRLRVAFPTSATGWVVDVSRHETRWRARKIVHSETLSTLAAVIDRASELAELVQHGTGRIGWWRP